MGSARNAPVPGIMQQRLPVGHVYRINAESLEQVCSHVAAKRSTPKSDHEY
jgi:hypothetical protein